MNFFLALCINDFRSTYRDPVFKALLFFPFLSFVIIRWLIPYLAAHFSVLVEYKEVILMWGCLQSSIMFGFIYGFLFLEEKEEHVSDVIRVMPISGFKLVSSRLFLGVVISTVVDLCLVYYGGIFRISLIKAFLVSFQFSLSAPLIALVLGALANNRIEGLAQMKVLNLLLILPGLIYFLPQKAMHLTAVIPTYWSFKTLEFAGSNDLDFSLFLVLGFIIHFLFMWWFNRKMAKTRR